MKQLNEILPLLNKVGCDYEYLLSDIVTEKKKAQNSNDEHIANYLWAEETIVKIVRDFVSVFNLLKQEEFYKAWCAAEQVELCINNLIRNFPDFYQIVSYHNTIIHQLQRLYPYRLFASYVINIKREECSICHKPRSIRSMCGHRKGYVYNGELCYNTVTDLDIISIDLVQNPVHKYAVLFLSDEKGDNQNDYDYGLLKGLMRYWKDPFQPWNYRIEDIRSEEKDFSDLTSESLCPCGSGEKYGACCKNNPLGIKHKKYIFYMDATYEQKSIDEY